MPTQEEAEAAYDAEIAPALLKIVERCKELGIHMVAHVEWWPGETGITQHVPDDASVQMKMTWLAAHAHGNFDSLGIAMLKCFDCRASLFLNRYAAGDEELAARNRS
ncbi:MAG: hypothetical protein E6Q97_31405 [Desulfurellales bacterium]|nr:MAG: hypothetical protein E6Q97_31405 [Desulfurellales bacterium]